MARTQRVQKKGTTSVRNKKKRVSTKNGMTGKRKIENLLIVESPAKAKTIKKYLGKDYEVMATVGHVIDLPKSGLSVDTEHGYKPKWMTIKGKGAVLKRIKSAIKSANHTYLATDLDREGEAIAWHVQEYVKEGDLDRIVFNAVTKSALLDALKKPRKIDRDLVQSQIARRVLDRLVGYKLTEVLWHKIWYGLSAGRVQSVALRLIVEREELRDKFVPEEYWDIHAKMQEADQKYVVEASLTKRDGKKYQPQKKSDVDALQKDIKGKEFVVAKLSSKRKSKTPPPPMTTSMMQQAANNILGFSAKRTMGLAQALYQNGYITYMRTDSVALSAKALEQIRQRIEEIYGTNYLSDDIRRFKNKSKNAQEAHEAIRPTDITKDPGLLKDVLNKDESKLYSLIYNRALASQMAAQEVESISADLDVVGNTSSVYTFHIGGEKVLFDGYRKVIPAKADGEIMPVPKEMSEGDRGFVEEVDATQKFTKPKARYTEATLVKKLEELGIGRPSTYASIISTILARGYVVKIQKALKPTDVGRVVIKLLRNNFERLIDYDYTAGVEGDLDKIAAGAEEYESFIDREYKPLVQEIAKAEKEVKKEDLIIFGKSDEKCDKCGKDMYIKLGKYGKFLTCEDFPKCKGIKPLSGDDEDMDFEKYYLKQDKCPKCGGKMQLKNSKYGKFWGCENYPKCKHTVGLLLQEKCPECGSHLVERVGKWGKTFIGCSGYPDCRYIKKNKKTEDAA